MGKKKSFPEVEHYRGRVKELEKLNKALRRRLRKLEKNAHNYNSIEDIEDERGEDGMYDVKPENICNVCGKNPLIFTDLGIKHLYTCVCGYKKIGPANGFEI